MSAHGESCILNVLSKKAGLCDNVKVMRRANELHRLLQVMSFCYHIIALEIRNELIFKSHGCLGTTASLGASATALAVICLHLVSSNRKMNFIRNLI